MISVEYTSIRSNVRVTGFLCMLIIERSHEHLIGFALANLSPHPCTYLPHGVATVKLTPRISQSAAASYMSPVQVGAPASTIGLGSARFTDPLSERVAHPCSSSHVHGAPVPASVLF